ncbi:hypothetical protein [Dyadobacter psychrotolerans]|uniref:Uncharacterized protein n=1 Tax=Dyadobacter psychrotolerans TaxID=2541721 RepID=A0A4V2Z463_9BACT|nr:hypothetical protein [Dyadobacter psychrotolerans]TDE15388.1 hypothetical protein E0F88_12810 [Dyadobacter psychrotolerans]
MKNTKNMLVGAMIAMTIATYANANNTSLHTIEEKTKVSVVNSVLPVSLPVLETPAPVAVKITNDTNKHNAVQKAAIVGLQLKSQSAK